MLHAIPRVRLCRATRSMIALLCGMALLLCALGGNSTGMSPGGHGATIHHSAGMASASVSMDDMPCTAAPECPIQSGRSIPSEAAPILAPASVPASMGYSVGFERAEVWDLCYASPSLPPDLSQLSILRT